MLPQEIFWIVTPQSPFNFLHFRVIQTGYLLTLETIFQTTWKSLVDYFLIKIIFVMKTLIDFRKTVENN